MSSEVRGVESPEVIGSCNVPNRVAVNRAWVLWQEGLLTAERFLSLSSPGLRLMWWGDR